MPAKAMGLCCSRFPIGVEKECWECLAARAARLIPHPKLNLETGFYSRKGSPLAWLGWQFDVPEESDLMRLYAPVATRGSNPIRGLMRSEHIPEKKTRSFSLGDRTMIPYPVVNPNDAALRLTVRDRRDGRRQTIPRRQWQFARDED